MANENTDLEKEFEDLQKEYEEIQKEVEEETSMQDVGVSDTVMHVFNISISVIMIVIGAILVYKTRGTKLKSGKKIAGWILLILGVLVLITHAIQMII